MYSVEVFTRGKYNNVERGCRLFLRKKKAIEFSNKLDEVESENHIYKVIRLTRGCYAGAIPYYKKIDMLDYECDDYVSNAKYFFLRLFTNYKREIMEEFLLR